jgi:hypothetical protein
MWPHAPTLMRQPPLQRSQHLPMQQTTPTKTSMMMTVVMMMALKMSELTTVEKWGRIEIYLVAIKMSVLDVSPISMLLLYLFFAFFDTV